MSRLPRYNSFVQVNNGQDNELLHETEEEEQAIDNGERKITGTDIDETEQRTDPNTINNAKNTQYPKGNFKRSTGLPQGELSIDTSNGMHTESDEEDTEQYSSTYYCKQSCPTIQPRSSNLSYVSPFMSNSKQHSTTRSVDENNRLRNITRRIDEFKSNVPSAESRGRRTGSRIMNTDNTIKHALETRELLTNDLSIMSNNPAENEELSRQLHALFIHPTRNFIGNKRPDQILAELKKKVPWIEKPHDTNQITRVFTLKELEYWSNILAENKIEETIKRSTETIGTVNNMYYKPILHSKTCGCGRCVAHDVVQETLNAKKTNI